MSLSGLLFAVASLLAAFGSMVAWQREPESTAATTSADGAALFHAKGCAACHDGPDSSALTGATFPSLADVSTWAGERQPILSAEHYLTESIREPGAFRSPMFSPDGGPTTAMPELELTDAEVDAIVKYLLAG